MLGLASSARKSMATLFFFFFRDKALPQASPWTSPFHLVLYMQHGSLFRCLSFFLQTENFINKTQVKSLECFLLGSDFQLSMKLTTW